MLREATVPAYAWRTSKPDISRTACPNELKFNMWSRVTFPVRTHPSATFYVERRRSYKRLKFSTTDHSQAKSFDLFFVADHYAVEEFNVLREAHGVSLYMENFKARYLWNGWSE